MIARFAILVLASSVVTIGTVARAATCAGVTFPEVAEVDGAKLVLNGVGLRQATMLRLDVYVAALYVEDKSADGASIARSDKLRKLALHILRDVSKRSIARGWSEGPENSAVDSKPLARRIATLSGYMIDVTSGDEITFTYRPKAGLEVAIAGKVMGVIPGADFAEAFFNIWLGAKPPNPELKRGLLGGPCEA